MGHGVFQSPEQGGIPVQVSAGEAPGLLGGVEILAEGLPGDVAFQCTHGFKKWRIFRFFRKILRFLVEIVVDSCSFPEVSARLV